MGELHLKPKLSMFCALSQNYQQCMKNNVSVLKQIEKLKNGIVILLGQVVLELLIKPMFYTF